MKEQHKVTGVFSFFFETFEGWDQVDDFVWGFYKPTGFGEIFGVDEKDFDYIEIDIDKGIVAIYPVREDNQNDYEYVSEEDSYPVGCVIKKVYEIRSDFMENN